MQTSEHAREQCALAERASESRRDTQLQQLNERRKQLPLGSSAAVLCFNLLFNLLHVSLTLDHFCFFRQVEGATSNPVGCVLLEAGKSLALHEQRERDIRRDVTLADDIAGGTSAAAEC